jgi:signal transduction histidine kinase
LRQWFEPPRRLLGLFLAVMVTMTAALGWLGWRLLEQDRELSRQRIQERLEGAADLAAAALVRKLSETETLLTMPAAESGHEDVVTVVFGPEQIEAHPAGKLPYYPFVPSARGPEPGVFAAGESLEFQQRNYAGAAVIFRDLTRSPDPAIRAGALLRLARNLRKSGAVEDALAVYDELARAGAIPVEGLPAALAARYARLVVLRELQRMPACEQEARMLYDDLRQGRWRLTRGLWSFYITESRRCFHPDPEEEAYEKNASALAGGVEWLWQEWQRIRSGEGRTVGRTGLWIDDRPVLVLWRSTSERFDGVVAGSGFLSEEWEQALRPIEQRQSARFAINDAEGYFVLGSDLGASSQQIVRSLTDVQLPWTLRTASADPGAELARVAMRRRLLFLGLGLAGLLVFAGGYFITRALSRELEVARLQSDFVAAVSHEFRTPLASLRQMSELLADGRVSNDERRQAYYEALRTESERLHRLVENLLDFGRMEAGVKEYRFESVDPVILVKDVAQEFAETVRDKGYHIEAAANSHLPRIRADREALGLALWNLLDNAVKYSPDSKTVWIETGRQHHEIAIRVRDQGAGIALEDQKEIFKKFVRAGAAKAAGVKGAGLGLAMVEHIVSRHGGRVCVTSQPGEGSTFTILLPADKDDGRAMAT